MNDTTKSATPETLATGDAVALRRWEEAAGEAGDLHTREYETVGTVVEGRLEVTVDGATRTVGAGEGYVVAAGAERRYRVLDDLVAIEATSPPAGT